MDADCWSAEVRRCGISQQAFERLAWLALWLVDFGARRVFRLLGICGIN